MLFGALDAKKYPEIVPDALAGPTAGTKIKKPVGNANRFEKSFERLSTYQIRTSFDAHN